jgi:DNA-binding transcriptional ArsR family regulator
VVDVEHPDIAVLALPTVLFALSDPARLDIVRQLADPQGPAPTCQSVALDMAKSTRSHHLKVLREAGVVQVTQHGRERLLALRRGDLESRWPGLLTAVLADGQQAALHGVDNRG